MAFVNVLMICSMDHQVKRKIMKLGLQRKQTSMSEAAMEAILAEGPIIPGAVSPS